MTKSTWLKNKELKDSVGTINVVVAVVLVIINVALILNK